MKLLRHVPNILTAMRIPLAFAFIFTFFNESGSSAYLGSFAIFTASAVTDVLDGILARALKCESDFGRLADPFADKLTHRDFLGSILSLGIERSTLGDIVIRDNVGYLFAKDDIASYIADSLTKIKHTDVKCEITQGMPEGELYKTEIKRIQANGERLDAIVAKVFCISRKDEPFLEKQACVVA